MGVHSLHVPAAGRESLAEILGFVDDVCRQDSIEAEAAFALRLAVEESCMNIIKHGYRDAEPGPIRLMIECDDRRMRIIVEDHARPFDPTTRSAPDPQASADDREIGGLGVHLIRQMMDEITWEPLPDGGNRLRLTKRHNSNPQ